MGDRTGIEWTEATWNPVVGCSLQSPGCTNCYAMGEAARLERMGVAKYAGLTKPSKAGPVWTGEVRLHEDALDQPIRWKRSRRIFVNSMSDLFHEAIPDHAIDRVFAVMALARHHTFQVLTKRAERMKWYMCRLINEPCHVGELVDDMGGDWDSVSTPLPNVWLGVSVEDQKRADERIPHLLATPAAVRFLSMEPLLGPVDLTCVVISEGPAEFYGHPNITKARFTVNALAGVQSFGWRSLDWVIVGGESGPKARPSHPDWVRSLRDQCAVGNVPFLFKQHGEWIGVPDLRNLPGGTGPGFGVFDHCQYDMDAECVRVGKRAAGRLLDGVIHDGMPQSRDSATAA
ncbi:DUF5131 family protein [Azospirillum brasilense]|uniref:phage Gp37/Gp68 family protein n=1 Tax=Azospirillum argentinense TaxID=2970906 RepID=UPI001909B454|nr:phage Gp37/Gp68 family protein [Azospirillum argentinense]MBK3798675.1 DUF5131 family protein [Azospirillum argentinense]